MLRYAAKYGSGSELTVLYNCSVVHEDDRYADAVIPDKKRWTLMNKAYQASMAKYRTKEDKYDSFPKGFQKSGISVLTEVRIVPLIGRGIYAKEDIANGTVVWTSTNTAEFRSGDAFRKFIKLLAKDEKDAACDSLVWSYLVEASSDEYAVCVDMDEGGLFNDYDEDDELNVAGINREVKYGCNGRSLYATRDIPAGEELRLDYGSFCQGDWNELGICQWGELPPSRGCEEGANDTYLKDEGIKARITDE